MTHDAAQRSRAIERLKLTLLRTTSPRLHMSGILLLTLAAGFLSSFLMLHAGLTTMSVRYPLAILLGYGAFLLMLRAWLHFYQARSHGSSSNFNIGDLLDAGGSRSSTSSGGGGGFRLGGGRGGGGGAGRSFDQVPLASTSSPMPTSVSHGGGGSKGGGGGFSFDLDLDDFWIILLIVVAVCAVLAVFGFLIYSAPAMMAEMALDGMMVGGLYKRVKTVQPQHWLRTIFGRTWIALALLLAVFIVVGHYLQKFIPEAHSMADMWRSVFAE